MAPVRNATFNAAGHLPVPGSRRGPYVSPHGDAHPDESREARERGAEQEAEHPEPASGPEGQGHRPIGTAHLGGGEEDEDGQGHDDDGDGPELAPQEGDGTLLNGGGDLHHLGSAGVGPKYAAHEGEAHDDAEHSGDQSTTPSTTFRHW